jgi:hypothetical protein
VHFLIVHSSFVFVPFRFFHSSFIFMPLSFFLLLLVSCFFSCYLSASFNLLFFLFLFLYLSLLSFCFFPSSGTKNYCARSQCVISQNYTRRLSSRLIECLLHMGLIRRRLSVFQDVYCLIPGIRSEFPRTFLH